MPGSLAPKTAPRGCPRGERRGVRLLPPQPKGSRVSPLPEGHRPPQHLHHRAAKGLIPSLTPPSARTGGKSSASRPVPRLTTRPPAPGRGSDPAPGPHQPLAGAPTLPRAPPPTSPGRGSDPAWGPPTSPGRGSPRRPTGRGAAHGGAAGAGRGPAAEAMRGERGPPSAANRRAQRLVRSLRSSLIGLSPPLASRRRPARANGRREGREAGRGWAASARAAGAVWRGPGGREGARAGGGRHVAGVVAGRGAVAVAAVGEAPGAGGRAGAPPLGLRLPLPPAALHPLRRLLPAARLGRLAPPQRPAAARPARPPHPGAGETRPDPPHPPPRAGGELVPRPALCQPASPLRCAPAMDGAWRPGTTPPPAPAPVPRRLSRSSRGKIQPRIRLRQPEREKGND